MQAPELDRLLTLAEIAVAVAGFSAIVVLFKRREKGTWLAPDADRFNGMIVHSVSATLLCLLPSGLGVFIGEPARLWSVASVLMGIQVAGHAGIVAFYLRTTGPVSALVVVGGGLFVVALQAMNALGIGFDRSAGPYVIGVLWHLVHAVCLFAGLVWVREDATLR